MPARTKPKTRRKGRVALAVVLAAIVALGIFFFAYTGVYYHAATPLNEVAHEGIVLYETAGYIAVSPDGKTPQAGFILYQGAKVDEAAYVPYLVELAGEGIFCAVVKSPFRLAILGPNGAERVVEDYPGITEWFVGGHSLGGVMAAGYAEKHPVAGLILLAAYPSADLSGLDVPVLSITASEDGVLDREKYEDAKAKLPPGTVYADIAGGNHGQFGDYGPQNGDGAALISSEEQRAEVVALVAGFLTA